MKKLLLFIFILIINNFHTTAQVPQGDTYLQGFYWNSVPGGVWWDSLYKLSASLKSAGFSAVWIPSANKGAGGPYSMGYDIYDHYDFGEFYQKGSIETRFGTRVKLEKMIDQFHKSGMEIYYDAVLNHTAGGELKGKNSCRPDSAYVIFTYPNGSRRFPKNANSFNPSEANSCNQSPPYNSNEFTFANDNCTDNPAVRDSLIVWGKYLKEILKIDGARLDAVKHVNPGFIANWATQAFSGKYVVSEFWGSADEIKNYYNSLAAAGGGNIALFDFPLRYTLESMCNNQSGTFDMRNLDWAGLIRGKGMSGFNVSTFVENHDVDRSGWNGIVDTSVGGHMPIITDKHLAYAFIIFSEGRPCVFFRDYFVYGLKSKIDTLIYIRHKFLGGNTTFRDGLSPYYIRQDNNQDQNALAADIFIARRNGWGSQPGGYLVINDNPNKWIDIWVDTESPIGTVYKDYAGRDANKTVVGPEPGRTKNRIKLWAPPRSYTIYVADTTAVINQAPVLLKVDNIFNHTFNNLNYRFYAQDANNDSLIYTIQNNPAWLKLSGSGVLSGIPAASDTGKFNNIIVTVTDIKGASDKDTFNLTVYYNTSPKLNPQGDTTIYSTYRFERKYKATDLQNDTLYYKLSQKPDWLNIDELSGIMAGTPSVTDTGLFRISVEVSDRKGGVDSTGYNLIVKAKRDSIIYTYAKPVIDGTINISSGDWKEEWRRTADPHDDSRWTTLNEFYDLLMTWDADSLYIGASYTLKDNTFILLVDLGLNGGVTDFNSNSGYKGSFNRNFRLRTDDNIDLMIAGWNKETPRVYLIADTNSYEITDKCNRQGTTQAEIAISWNSLYKLGPGLVRPNTKIKLVGMIAGGENWGAGDAAPSQCDIDLCPPGADTLYQGPDSLLVLDTVAVDINGDGIPDPTITIVSADKNNYKVISKSNYYLEQNYPNPFNPATTIKYYVIGGKISANEKIKTTLKVYDITGKEVATLVDEMQTPGEKRIVFLADKYGLSSGVYFIKLQLGDKTEAKKMMYLK